MRWVFLLIAFCVGIQALPLGLRHGSVASEPRDLTNIETSPLDGPADMEKRSFRALSRKYPIGAEIEALQSTIAKINHFDGSAHMYTNKVSYQLNKLWGKIKKTTPPLTIQRIIFNLLAQAKPVLLQSYHEEDKGDYYGLIGKASGLIGHAQSFT